MTEYKEIKIFNTLFKRSFILIFEFKAVKGQEVKSNYVHVIPVMDLHDIRSYRKDFKSKSRVYKKDTDEFNRLKAIVLNSPSFKTLYAEKNINISGQIQETEISSDFFVHFFMKKNKIPERKQGKSTVENNIYYETTKNRYINTPLNKFFCMMSSRTGNFYLLPIYFFIRAEDIS